MTSRLRSSDIFINCPFDPGYRPVFEALIFSILDLGFVPRCGLEVDDGTQSRLGRIARIIEECLYGVHDLSYVRLDPKTRLPRFNMPLELGIYLGCKHFGGKHQNSKNCLILDTHRFRYRAFLSDISGQDIHAYNGSPKAAIAAVRDWLRVASQRRNLAGGSEIYARYRRFKRHMPKICSELKLHPSELTFVDYSETARIWLSRNR